MKPEEQVPRAVAPLQTATAGDGRSSAARDIEVENVQHE